MILPDKGRADSPFPATHATESGKVFGYLHNITGMTELLEL